MYGPWTQHDDGGIAPWYMFLMLGLWCYITTNGLYFALKERFSKTENSTGGQDDLKKRTIWFVVSWSVMALMIWNPVIPKF